MHRLLEWRLHTQRYSRSSLHTLYFERLITAPLTELRDLYAFFKSYRPNDLPDLDPAKAARWALLDLTGNEKRVKKSEIDPYKATLEHSGETLRHWGCQIVKDNWKEDVWGPCLI